jgi:hypothetical protein
MDIGKVVDDILQLKSSSIKGNVCPTASLSRLATVIPQLSFYLAVFLCVFLFLLRNNNRGNFKIRLAFRPRVKITLTNILIRSRMFRSSVQSTLEHLQQDANKDKFPFPSR